MALYLGAAAKYKFSHVRLMDCIINLAEIFDTNPNITIPDLADYYGAPVEHMEMFSHLMFDKNHTLMVENTQYLRDIEPTLPHPMFYPAVIPLVVSFTIVGTLVMMARFYSRLSILGRIPFYDWLMLVGFVCLRRFRRLRWKHVANLLLDTGGNNDGCDHCRFLHSKKRLFEL